MEVQVSAERFGLQIAQDCEAEQRELDGFVGSVLQGFGEAPRNPLRPEVIGNAMIRSVDQVTDRPDQRKVLIAELGRSLAASLPETYAAIVADMRAAGLKPATPSFRGSERGSGFGRTSSGYDTSSRPVGLDDGPPRAAAIRATAAGAATAAGPRSAAASAAARGAGRAGAGHADRPCRRRPDVADPPPGLHRPGARRRGFGLRAGCRLRAIGTRRLRPAQRAGRAEPDPRAPRRAARGLQRLARSHGDRRHRQPVRPDPVRPEGAAADGAPDRAAAAAGAARRARRPELLLVAQAPGAALRQPHRLAGQRLRGLRFRIGPALPEAGARAGAGDRRRRLRPDRGLRAEAVGARELHRRAGAARGAGRQQCRLAADREGNRPAAAAALHAAAAGAAEAAAGGRLRPRLHQPGVEPGADARGAAGRRRQRARQAPAPRRRAS